MILHFSKNKNHSKCNLSDIGCPEHNIFVSAIARWETKAGKNLTCTHWQYPLIMMLALGITIHKSQDLTLEKVVVELGDKDFTVGLTFVATSGKNILQ